jgi:hypothetical protein
LDAALRQAQDLRERGEIDAASRLLGQLVIAAPNDARVIGEYGKVMLESGRTDDAVAFLERALTLNETDWTLFSALGVAYDQTGKAEAARAAFNLALALKPGEPAVLSNLALSHIQVGELDEAERLLAQASAQESEIPGLADKLAMVRSLKSTSGQRPAVAPIVPPATDSLGFDLPLDTDEAETSAPNDPETKTAALAARQPVITMVQRPSQIEPVSPASQVRDSTAPVAPKAARSQPDVASALKPAAKSIAPRAAAPQHTLRATGPEPRPAGVARAITRTATVPLAALQEEPWESRVRVSLPPQSSAVERPNAAVAADPPVPSSDAEQPPPGWFDVLWRWASALIGFVTGFWA